MRIYPNFTPAIQGAHEAMRYRSYRVESPNWQSTDVSNKPDMSVMHEVLNHTFQVPIPSEDLGVLRIDIQPNLPWADDHFLERVGGKPLNPGEQWRNWPWSHSADRHRKDQGRFSHTYMERYWPMHTNADGRPNRGIRYQYGDLSDVVMLLLREPNTRQAYLPVWFPEDTGVHHGERVPCTLGYHLIQRHGFLHINYFIRSCDLIRHFQDDIYLTVRLLLWVLDQLKGQEKEWGDVKPGLFTMFITSLHCFRNDYIKLYGSE